MMSCGASTDQSRMTRPEREGTEPLILDLVSRESVSLQVALSTVAMDGGTWLAGIVKRQRSKNPTNRRRTGSEPWQPEVVGSRTAALVRRCIPRHCFS